MNEWENITLSDGLIVFGARAGMGITTSIIKLANELARKERVTFVSYQDHMNGLCGLLDESEIGTQSLLSFNFSVDYFNSNLEFELERIVNEEQSAVLIIDSLDDMLIDKDTVLRKSRDQFILGLSDFNLRSKCKIIMTVALPDKLEQRGGDMRPRYRDFNWCRELCNQAVQVFALYRPSYYGITHDEYGNAMEGVSEVIVLK